MEIYEVKFIIKHKEGKESLEKEISFRIPLAEIKGIKKVTNGIRATTKHSQV